MDENCREASELKQKGAVRRTGGGRLDIEVLKTAGLTEEDNLRRIEAEVRDMKKSRMAETRSQTPDLIKTSCAASPPIFSPLTTADWTWTVDLNECDSACYWRLAVQSLVWSGRFLAAPKVPEWLLRLPRSVSLLRPQRLSAGQMEAEGASDRLLPVVIVHESL